MNALSHLARSVRHALCIALLGCAGIGQALAAEPVWLRLIGLNDFHGNLEPTGLTLTLADPQGGERPLRVPTGGAAALGGLVQALRSGAPNSLMLSGGDLFGASPLVSTLFRHESTIEVMNAIGLDAAAVGNHEFDAGAAELRRLAEGGCPSPQPEAVATSCALAPYRGARFPFLAANVVAADGSTLFAPAVVREFGGVRVGIIGAVTRNTPRMVMPSGVAGLRFTDEAAAINRAAQRLKTQGVRVLVATIHEGGEVGPTGQRADWNDTSCPGARGRIFEIARRMTRDVAVIFSAHTHQGYRCVVDGRVIIQGTSYGRGVSVVDVAIDPQTRAIVPALTRSINLPVLNELVDAALRERLAAALPAPYDAVVRDARPDAAIAARVATYAEVVAPKAAQPVGRIGGSFARGGRGDSAAGRLIADSQLAATQAPAAGGAQIALMNAGGIRTDLECKGTPPCVATYGQLAAMQPFGNSLVVMTLTGAQLKALLEAQQRQGAAEPTWLQPSAGFTYTWRSDAAPGERVSEMRLNGEAVVPERAYRVTVNSYLAEGGDAFGVLTRGSARTGGGQDLDALVAYLKAAERAPVPAPRVTRLP